MSVGILVDRDTSWAERCAVTTVFFGSASALEPGRHRSRPSRIGSHFRTAPSASRCWRLQPERSCRCRSQVCSRRDLARRA